MSPPPFQPNATLRSLREDLPDKPGPLDAGAQRLRPVAHAACCPLPPRRQRLVDLDQYFHCSVIGTCVGTAALRKLVARHTDLDATQASDLQVHHAAVSLAIEGGAGAKALQKLMDELHSVAVRRAGQIRDDAGLRQLWSQALQTGDIPGAYWALMTHPLVSEALRKQAFGDVHMLSHLVGAANRADIRRLVALEQTNARLHDQLAQQQARHHEASAQQDERLAHLQARHDALRMQWMAQQALPAAQADALQALRAQLLAREQQVALHTQRREAAEQEIVQLQQSLNDALGRLDRTMGLLSELHQEQRALEAELLPAATDAQAPQSPMASPLQRGLQGTRLLYVGGRPGSNQAIRQLVEAAGGEWLHHDGGLEDRKGLLPPLLARAHRVVFPVDCIDHDSMQQLKRLCMRHGLPYQPLRTASVASFVMAVAAADDSESLVNGAALVAGRCIKG